MDFRLKVSEQQFNPGDHVSFNPCSNGLSAQSSASRASISSRRAGFNPCSNGLSAQRGHFRGAPCRQKPVSILVLMDFRLKEAGIERIVRPVTGFNPCSNGLSAQRKKR